MADNKSVEVIIFSSDKQKELYDIIVDILADELKNGNCFILPYVDQKAGDILRKNGFERVNKVLFLGAPMYFKVGFNTKNATAISLIGYPDDSSFSETRNPNFVPEGKLPQTSLTIEQQKKLAEIFVSTFRHHNVDGKVLLSIVGKFAGKKIAEAGLDRASLELFDAAKEFFTVSRDAKGYPQISLKEGCGFTLSDAKKPISVVSAPRKSKPALEDIIYESLKKTYRTNDVSVKNIVTFIRDNKFVLTPDISIEELIDKMADKHGGLIRDNGEGTIKERYIILRKPLPMPTTVRSQVELIIAENFLDSCDLIPNGDVGTVLKKNGVNFKEYNYTDLTAFIRDFENIFSIVPKPSVNNGVQIFVRIKDEFKKKYDGVKFEHSREDEQITQKQFEKIVSDLYDSGKYTEIIEQSLLREAIKHSNVDMWNCIFKAYQAITLGETSECKELTEWEKAVIDFDTLSENVSIEQLSRFGFDDVEIVRIKKYISEYSHKTANYSTFGQRIQTLCGQTSYLAELVYQIGLVAKVNGDKAFCFRLLILYYSRTDEAKMYDIWNRYASECINTGSIIMIVGTLFSEGKFDIVEKLVELYEQENEINNVVRLYYSYAKAIGNIDVVELPALSIIENRRALEIINICLNQAVANDNIGLFFRLMFLCIKYPGQYVSLSNLQKTVVAHLEFVSNNIENLLDLAEKTNKEIWTVLYYYYSNELLSRNERWDNLTVCLKQDYMNKIANATDSNRTDLLYEAIAYFPTEKFFVDSLLSLIKHDNSNDPERLEAFVSSLVENGNYEQVVMLFEHDSSYNFKENVWFLQKLSFCYQMLHDPQKFIATEMLIISIQANSGTDIFECLSQLLEKIYTGMISKTLLSLDEETATKLLYHYDRYTCNERFKHRYCVAVMGLALCSKNIPLMSLMYCLEEPTAEEQEFFELCSEEIEESETGYAYRLGDMQKNYEYLLTQETPKLFFNVLAKAANVVRYKADEKLYNSLRSTNWEEVDATALVPLLIAEYNKERSWKLLSQYSVRTQKYSLNFVANAVWMFRFKDISYPLTNCSESLKRTVDDSLPRNFISCCLACLAVEYDKSIDSFHKAFTDHIVRCKSFKNTSDELILAFFNVLYNKKRASKDDFILALEIAKQKGAFSEFFDKFFNGTKNYKAFVKNNIGIFVAVCAAFADSADAETFTKLLQTIVAIRDELSTEKISIQDRCALMWVDDLIARRKERNMSDYFIEASAELLSSYPAPPHRDVVARWITPNPNRQLPNYDLLKNWINTYGSLQLVQNAEWSIKKYIDKTWLPEDEEERVTYFKLKLFLTEKYILFFNPEGQLSNDDYLRRCKTYYALRQLINDKSIVPESFKVKMHKTLDEQNKLEEYLDFQKAVDAFISNVTHIQLREMFLYCGITNYWDICLDRCLDMTEELKIYSQSFESLFDVVDYRTIRRRLLQMFVFSTVAQIWIENENLDIGELKLQKDIKYFYNHISAGDFDIVTYHSKLFNLIEILQPALRLIVDKISHAELDEEKFALAKGVIFALTNKYFHELEENIFSCEKSILTDIVIPTISVIQYKTGVSSLFRNLAFAYSDETLDLLNVVFVAELLGDYETHLFKSICHIKRKEFSKASTEFIAAGSNGTTHRSLYVSIKESIENETDIELPQENENSRLGNGNLIQFSFAKRTETLDSSLQQLVVDFYSENLHDVKGKCLIASKIYTLLLDGQSYRDTKKFLFDWGFCEIDATFDIDRKANILFELADNVDKIENEAKLFKDRFVERFVYLLQEFDYSFLVKNFKKIFNCQKILYRMYSPYDNCECYAQAIILLGQLFELGQNNVDPQTIMAQIEEKKSNILKLHLKYPQNRFANKCIDFAELFIQQIFERGIFEVRILNENKVFSGTIFYQIRNIGYELISNLALTFFIEGFSSSMQRIQINSIIPEGLRPGQVYAGEYSPTIKVKEGEQIGCSVTVKYTTFDDGSESHKTYTVINPTTDGRLTAQEANCSIYQKNGGAGYLEESIKQGSDFIGRKSELDRIMGKALRGQNVLLYGTNGTGKSSILNNIRTVCLPEAYGHDKRYYVTGMLTFDDCTEKTIFESIVKSISGTTLFKAFLRRKANDETLDIISLATEEWNENVPTMFDDSGHCINTDAVRQYFVALDEALMLSNLDLYILIDQFERVISSENVDSKHMLFLRDLTCSRIRFIVAGSNYLLEEVAVDKTNDDSTSSWSDIFSRGFAEKEKIGNMSRKDFVSLMTQPNALNNGTIHYSDEALDFLWQYTNGHAFYSCLLGNRVLDILSERKVRRTVIYPSDIFIAIYQSGDYLPSEVSNKEKETAIKDQIFQDIIDNTAIKYVGKVLAKLQSQGERKVTYQKLKDYVEDRRPDLINQFNDSLAVLVARDFITYTTMDWHKRTGDEHPFEAREYFFTSDLYLEHFAKVFIEDISEEERQELTFRKQSIEEIAAELENRPHKEIKTLKEILPDMFGGEKVIHVHGDGTVVVGDQHITIENMIVNQISNSIVGLSNLLDDRSPNGMLDTGEVQKCLNGIPRLELLPSGSVVSSDDEFAIFDTDHYVETVEEGVRKAVEEKAKYANIRNWAEEHRDKLNELGVSDLDYILSRPEEECNSILIALYLRCLFDDVVELSSITVDYAPVTIMMCKTIERILKEKHLPLFLDPTIWKYQVKSFSDDPNVKRTVITFNDPTIGTFTTALFAMFTPSNNDPEKALKDEIREAFVARTLANSGKWKSYLFNLVKAKKIRNKTAHIDTITQDDCDAFIKLFFKLSLLKNTNEFVE